MVACGSRQSREGFPSHNCDYSLRAAESCAMADQEGHRRVLTAIAETLIPVVETPPSAATDPATAAFLATPIPDGVAEACLNAIAALPKSEQTEVHVLLGLLNTRVGTAAVCLSAPWEAAFPDRPVREREFLLLGIAQSRFALRRKIFCSLKQLIARICLTITDEGGRNPYWGSVGYQPISDELSGATTDPAVPEATTTRASLAAASIYSTMRYITEETEIEVDCVVVGSGAGGGVVAAELSQAGYTVLVLEKGPHVCPEDVTTLEAPALNTLYEKAGLLTTDDGAIGILAGSNMGGGTTVNWACCIPLPTYVREEWADPAGTHKLPQFAPPTPSAADKGEQPSKANADGSGGAEGPVAGKAGAPEATEYDKALAAVMQRIGASKDGVTHDAGNQILLGGAAKLGYAATTTAQNFDAPSAPSAGWTCFGDRYGNKQGTMVTYLADAAATGRCTFIENCAVDKVETAVDPTTGRRRAVGVVATVNRMHTVRVKARRCVVVSAGSLHSPGVLLRSGLPNPHIGRHLRLHPVTAVLGTFDRPNFAVWRGAPMTTVCTETERGPRGDYYGAKLEVPCVHPGLGAMGIPWHSGDAFKRSFLDFGATASIIVLTRDKGEGRVCLGGTTGFDPPKVHYTLCPDDAHTLLWSAAHVIKIMAVEGAAKIFTAHAGPAGDISATIPEEHRGDPDCPEVKGLLETVAESPTAPGTLGVFSAHQMGTCRMGWSPDTSVVDCDGETWDADDLYVMDASIFPTASGSNPMVTTLALSKMLSTRLVARLALEDGAADAAGADPDTRRLRRANCARGTSGWGIRRWVVAAAVVAAVAAAAHAYCEQASRAFGAE
eukprot:m.63720 g.63720  ORF g.63720 m.63720 type:complete len:838 (+) comp9676_c0_seq1:982-3495(+)